MFGRDRLVRRSLCDRFVVTLTSGESFEGLLLDADEKTVRLIHASAVDGASRVSVDGELFLPRGSVAYMQKPGEAAG